MNSPYKFSTFFPFSFLEEKNTENEFSFLFYPLLKNTVRILTFQEYLLLFDSSSTLTVCHDFSQYEEIREYGSGSLTMHLCTLNILSLFPLDFIAKINGPLMATKEN